MKPNNYVYQALELAKALQKNALLRHENVSFSKRLRPLLEFPKAKSFLIHLLDVAFRSKSYKHIASFVNKIFSKSTEHWVVFSGIERQMLRVFQLLGHKFPSISIPVMQDKIAEITQSVVFVKDSDQFQKLTTLRKQENIRLNINLIGEALMGEKEAKERIEKYLKLLDEPNVNYISIKISTIYSQIESIAYNETLVILQDRLSILYQKLIDVFNKTGEWKFINLDMEEYRDLALTVDTFMNTLSLPQFKNIKAGIVLQAYIPDSYDYMLKLQMFAHKRVKGGGAPIKIRVVKGANMEMEKTESSTHMWPLVTYENKIFTDGNYKKMLHELLKKESVENVHVGVASHNVFDLAYAITLVKSAEINQYVDFEMLEGMATALSHEILKQEVNVLLYTPLVQKDNFMSAIAYLVRRLDEGTADGNFLKEGFELMPDSEKWKEQEKIFLKALEISEHVSSVPKRLQNRLLEKYEIQKTGFSNIADTDWALAPNRLWLQYIIDKWKDCKTVKDLSIIPVSLTKKNRVTIEQSNYQGVIPWKYELADDKDFDKALSSYKKSKWLTKTHPERMAIIRKAAFLIQERRSDLIGIGMAELGKLVKELDSEISEAVDFGNYYAHSMEQLLFENDVEYQSEGINLILSPWNFPIAIPAGGVFASLVTGNAAILKPSTNAAACAYMLCECLWDAGVPKDALYFLPCEEKVLDKYLTTGNVFDAVILTGSTETARFLLERNPYLNLFAETGGKNATIITALADREQAVKNVIHSAFGNAGQKCSATSLLILEKEVYEDEEFKSFLIDAVTSKKVASPWQLDTQIGPLLVPINSKLEKLLLSTPEFRWLLKPKVEGYYMTPGIIWGVETDDEIFTQEFFGPILSVMCADDIVHAVTLANAVPFGLTSGLESLDDDEIEYWKTHIQAGNLYINRSTTGAIVQRQPFGGIKASCFGLGRKAGGPNYLTQFVKIKSNPVLEDSNVSFDSFDFCLLETEKQELHYAELSYKTAYTEIFEQEVDFANIRGQFNKFRYNKPTQIVCVVDTSVSVKDILLVHLAAKTLGVTMCLVSRHLLQFDYEFKVLGISTLQVQNWHEISQFYNVHTAIRILCKEHLPVSVYLRAHEESIHLYDSEVSILGRFELLNYLTEQSVSHSFHRYGNLMGKE